MYQLLTAMWAGFSLVSRPSHRPVFAVCKNGGEGHVLFITWMTSVPT